jgi:acetolactate synthase I/II/III large subunit
VVFDDGAYGNVRRMQRKLYGNRIIASDLRNPDFVRLAESFGMIARQVADPNELEGALADALSRGEPTLLTAKVGEMPDPWPYIHLPRVRG